MGVPDESKPLLDKKPVDAKQDAVAPAPRHLAVAIPEDNATERAWNGGLLQCFGSCDTTGVASAALVHSVPCVAFGHNVRLAFGKSFWKHAVVFGLLFSLWGYAYMGGSFRVGLACGPDFPPHHPSPHDMPVPGLKAPKQMLSGATLDEDLVQPHMLPDATWDKDILVEPTVDISTGAYAQTDASTDADAAEPEGRKLLHKHDHDDDDDDEDEHHHKDKHHKDKHHVKKWMKELTEAFNDDHHEPKGPKHGPPHGGPACKDARRHQAFIAFMIVLSFLVGVKYAAKMRTNMRKRFNIPGSRCGDFWTWMFCGACALCQETRTLWHNNVHDGLWYGPTLLAAPAAEQPFLAPVAQAASKLAPTKPDTLHVPAEDSV